MMEEEYTFDHIPTKEETEKFEYFAFEYLESNPGVIQELYQSYVGIYFNEEGEASGIYVANSSVTQY